MPSIRKKTRRHPNIQAPSGFAFQIPEGHTRIIVNVRQPQGTIDKDEALKILKKRPQVKKVIGKIKYCGATNLYHVFSYKAA